MGILHHIAGAILKLAAPREIKEQAKRFRRALESENREIVIYTDTDGDGYTAGANLAVALKRMGKKVKLRPVDRDEIRFDDPDAVYVLSDIRMSKDIQALAQNAGVRIYYVDHHPPDSGWENVVSEHLNSKILEPSGTDWYHWNTSTLVHIAFGDLLHDRTWLTAAGIYGDRADRGLAHKLFVAIHGRVAKQIATLLGLSEHFPHEISNQELGTLVTAAERPEDLLNDPKLKELHHRFSTEVSRFISNPKEHAVVWDEAKKIMVLRLESDIRKIKSPVSSILGDKYKDWIIIVCQPWEGKIDCSLRAINWQERNVHMGEWAKEFASLSNGRGGGHPVAAGLKFPEEHWEQFVEWVKKKIAQL